jgi:hypothetical protein
MSFAADHNKEGQQYAYQCCFIKRLHKLSKIGYKYSKYFEIIAILQLKTQIFLLATNPVRVESLPAECSPSIPDRCVFRWSCVNGVIEFVRTFADRPPLSFQKRGGRLGRRREDAIG